MGTQEFLRLDPESDADSEDSSGVELDLHAESAMDEFCSPGSSGIESGSEGKQNGFFWYYKSKLLLYSRKPASLTPNTLLCIKWTAGNLVYK